MCQIKFMLTENASRTIALIGHSRVIFACSPTYVEDLLVQSVDFLIYLPHCSKSVGGFSAMSALSLIRGTTYLGRFQTGDMP